MPDESEVSYYSSDSQEEPYHRIISVNHKKRNLIIDTSEDSCESSDEVISSGFRNLSFLMNTIYSVYNYKNDFNYIYYLTFIHRKLL